MRIHKFNENVHKMTRILTMDSVREMKHNLDYKTPGDFMENYGWDDRTIIDLHTPRKLNDKYYVSDAYTGNGELGYCIYENTIPTYLIGIYEPHGFKLIEDKDLFLVYGHENIVLLWLDSGKFDKILTR